MNQQSGSSGGGGGGGGGGGMPHFNNVSGIFGWLDDKLDAVIKPRVILIVLIVIGMFYFVISALGSGGGDGNTETTIFANTSILEILLWAIFIVIVLLNGFQYFFNTNITTELSNLFSTTPKIAISEVVPAADGDLGAGPSLKMRKQVFHVPASIYDYDNAKALCEAYGAKLANIDQMEEAHKSGAEWCSYGWSDNQMILYPTQRRRGTNFRRALTPRRKIVAAGRVSMAGISTMPL